MSPTIHSRERGIRVHYLANLGGLMAGAGLDHQEPDLLLGILLEVAARLPRLSDQRQAELRARGERLSTAPGIPGPFLCGSLLTRRACPGVRGGGADVDRWPSKGRYQVLRGSGFAIARSAAHGRLSACGRGPARPPQRSSPGQRRATHAVRATAGPRVLAQISDTGSAWSRRAHRRTAVTSTPRPRRRLDIETALRPVQPRRIGGRRRHDRRSWGTVRARSDGHGPCKRPADQEHEEGPTAHQNRGVRPIRSRTRNRVEIRGSAAQPSYSFILLKDFGPSLRPHRDPSCPSLPPSPVAVAGPRPLRCHARNSPSTETKVRTISTTKSCASCPAP